MNATATATDFAGRSAEQWREMARQCDQRREESFQRCDTDGFLSQWAADQMAQRYLHCAEIAEQGATMTCSALFDLEGNLVDAKYVEGRYGPAWGIRDPHNPRGQFLGFFNESRAQDPDRARATNARKGYYLGSARYRAGLEGSTGIPFATDEVVGIVDNGH